jgi:hypothetical protein
VFSAQALASLGSGWLLFRWQWRGVLLACLPLLLGFAYLLLAQGQVLNRLKGTVGGIADAIE